MPFKPPSFRPSHLPSRAEQDRERGSARQRGYDSRWEKARLAFLAEHPLCVTCEAKGIIEPATVVDHVIPHRGNVDLFWDPGNWQALCVACHNAKTKAEGGRTFG
jgi:5-methylcytosine-specific restriction protein A